MEHLIREDGYINATELCKLGGKRLDNWLRNNKTKNFIKILENFTNEDKKTFVKVKMGGICCEQGTWIHPFLATNLAQWISVEFSVKVTLWIEEWKRINNNKDVYYNEIINIKPDLICQREKEIQTRLKNKLGGEIEVFTDSGYIDLLTDNEIIEIKNGKNWKEAVGQILMYGLNFPKHTKRIHLFDIEKNKNIEDKCKMYDINVSYENNCF